MSKAVRTLQSLFHTWFGLDYRSIALLRIGIGVTLLLDICQRAGDLYAHYSDLGVLPRSELFRLWNMGSFFSVHLISGEPWVMAILFLCAGLSAIFLIFGYRTRLAIIVSWILLVSIQVRNPIILQGGDIFLRAIVFFMLFLPLEKRWSLDRILNRVPKPTTKTVTTLATSAYVIQIVLLYVFTGLLKTGAQWHTEGTAVYYALSVDQLTTPFGHTLLGIPSILPYFTHIVWYAETYGPLLLFIPFRNWIFRLCAIVTFVGLQLGFNSAFRLGYFGLIAITALFGLLPSEFWDKILNPLKDVLARKGKAGLTIVYDTDCSFCYKVTLALAQVLVLNKETIIISSEKHTLGQEIMTKSNSWVLIDQEGRTYIEWEGVVTILRHSPWARFFAFIFAFRPIAYIGTKIYRHIANNRLSVCIPEPQETKKPYVIRVFCLILVGFGLFSALIWNIQSYTDKPVPSPILQMSSFIHVDQKFNMFAPFPLLEDGWYVFPGILKDGREIDILKNSPVSYEKPRRVAYTYKNQRWQKYMMNLWSSEFAEFRLGYGRYLCREWNKKYTGQSELVSFKMIFMLEKTPPPGVPTPEAIPTTIWEHRCF